MYHYVDAIQDTKGNALAGYFVALTSTVDSSAVTIYADVSATPIIAVSGIANKAKVDADGDVSLYVAQGNYNVDIYSADGVTKLKSVSNVPMFNGDLSSANNLSDLASTATALTNLGATTVGGNVFTLTNPSAITFPRYNADNTVSALTASAFRTAIGAGVGGGDLISTNNLSDVVSAATARTNLGATTVGANLFTLTNPSAITFPRYNADNTVSALSASAFRTAIGAGDLISTNNLSDLANAGTARTNLGLGSIATFPETTTAQYLANTSGKALSTDKVWAAAAQVTLTDAATVAVDLSLGINFTVTLGGNRTLGNPTNLKDGQTGCMEIKQDGTGTRTLAYSGNWKFAGGTAPVLTTTASARDLLFYQVIGTILYGTLVKDVK